MNALHPATPVSALNFALRAGKWNVARLLLEHGADPNTKEDDALIAAISDAGYREPEKEAMIQLLLQHGARPRSGTTDERTSLW